MKIIWILIVFAFVNFAVGREEFITIWAPNKVYDEKDYNVVILSNDISKRTEIALQFRRSYGTLALAPKNVQKVRVSNKDKTGSKKEFELFMTLHQNESTISGTRQMCMTQTLHKIEAEKKNFYAFIQTDKSIYNPEDTVKFRVVVIDRDLKRYHLNNINIKVTDSLNRPIKEFDDLDENFVGVFTNNFKLSSDASLGNYKISVVVDRLGDYQVSKVFAVQKSTLSPFDAHITIKDNQLLTNSVLQLSFYGKYSFGDFVRGNALLTIKCITNGQTVVTESFVNISGVQNIHYKADLDLKATTTTKLDYEAEISFTEPESGIIATKTARFTVHAHGKPKIEVNHPEKFMPGLPFGVKVVVYDWKDKLIEDSVEEVFFHFKYRLRSGRKMRMMVVVEIMNGVATYNINIPDDADELKIKVEYLQAVYEKNIEKGSVVVGVNKITVDHVPKNPKYGDIVDINVRSNSELDQVIAIITSRHGIIESRQINCNYQFSCKFDVTIRRSMLPVAKVVVYYTRDRLNMYQGETTISIEDLTTNTLDIELPGKVGTGKEVNMTFKTEPNSKVYLLGYEKRSTYSLQGNDIKKEDVVKELADFDGTIKITVFHSDNTNWHDCTSQELRRIALGRRNVFDHGGDDFKTNLRDDEEEDFDGDLVSDHKKKETLTSTVDEVRENFREVWLFEDFEVPDGELTKTFTTPDSITSWMISSFSMNAEHGLAIASPKELVVKNEFFIKVVLPYSIHFEEILQVDVMVYNYVNTKEALDVTVVMYDQEGKNSFRFFDDECSSTPSTNTKPSETVNVPYDNVRKVSFYIQAGSDRRDYEKIVKVRIDATATTRHGDTFQDKMVKELRVEPVGV